MQWPYCDYLFRFRMIRNRTEPAIHQGWSLQYKQLPRLFIINEIITKIISFILSDAGCVLRAI